MSTGITPCTISWKFKSYLSELNCDASFVQAFHPSFAFFFYKVLESDGKENSLKLHLQTMPAFSTDPLNFFQSLRLSLTIKHLDSIVE